MSNFAYHADNTLLSAIYIEPPVDVRSVPQNYTVHCITTGKMFRPEDITVKLFSEKYETNSTGLILSTPVLKDSATKTFDYFTEVSWSADKVETTATEFSDHGFTQFNGDHDWICSIQEKNEFLRTYIKGTLTIDYHVYSISVHTIAPNNSPSSLDVCNINGVTVTICWTAVLATEADGYVVYETTSENTSATDVGNITQHTLGELGRELMYNYTVRAYQDLLGIASAPLTSECRTVTLRSWFFALILVVVGESTITVNGSVIGKFAVAIVLLIYTLIAAGIVNMTWTLLNRNTSNMEVQYRIDCITMNTSNEQLHWTKNGTTLVNGTANLQTSLIGDDGNFITITTMDHNSVEIACSNQLFSRSIVVEGL